MGCNLTYFIQLMNPFRICPLVVLILIIKRNHIFDQVPIIVTDVDIAYEIQLRLLFAFPILRFPLICSLLTNL